MIDDEERERALHDLRIVRHQLLPRWKQVVLSWSTAFAVILSIATTVAAAMLPVRGMPIASVAGIGLTYASISMAGCVSGLVLALALPGSSRLRKWARMAGTTPNKSMLSDLIFSFFWAACCQLSVLFVSLLATAIGGPLLVGAPSPLPILHVVALIASLFVFYYALAQLYVVLQTLVQVGVLVILEERDGEHIESGAARETR